MGARVGSVALRTPNGGQGAVGARGGAVALRTPAPRGGSRQGACASRGGGRSSREKGQCNAYAPEPNKDGLVFERLRVSRQLQAAPQLCQNAADSCAAACFAGSQAAPAAHTRC